MVNDLSEDNPSVKFLGRSLDTLPFPSSMASETSHRPPDSVCLLDSNLSRTGAEGKGNGNYFLPISNGMPELANNKSWS